MLAEVLAFLDAQLLAMRAPHEGLRDYARLELRADTLQVVRQALEAYDRRFRLLMQAREAVVLLTKEATVAAVPVAEVVLADLRDNAATIAAALAQFGPIETAAELRVTAGEPLPK